jgi:hypothetical protein
MNHQHIQFKTGDIIVTKSNLPIVEHFGIVVVEDNTACVYHCLPGRNVACDTLSNFLQTYQFRHFRRTGLSKEKFYERYMRVRGHKYNASSFNCIHFVNFVTN